MKNGNRSIVRWGNIARSRNRAFPFDSPHAMSHHRWLDCAVFLPVAALLLGGTLNLFAPSLGKTGPDRILATVELISATCLFMAHWRLSRPLFLATMASAALTGGAFVFILRGDPRCGCFGSLLEVPPAATLALDSAVLGTVSLACIICYKGNGTGIIITWGIHSLLGCAAGVTIALYLGRPIAFVPAKPTRSDGGGQTSSVQLIEFDSAWIGKQFPLPLVNPPERLWKGNWLIVIFDPGCNACVTRVRRFLQTHATGNIALVSTTGLQSRLIATNRSPLELYLETPPEWLLTGPIACELSSGRIIRDLGI